MELNGLKIRLASLEDLKIVKELSVRARDDEKAATDRLDLGFTARELGEAR